METTETLFNWMVARRVAIRPLVSSRKGSTYTQGWIAEVVRPLGVNPSERAFGRTPESAITRLKEFLSDA